MPALTQRESPFAVLALAEAGMIGILIAAASLVLVTGAAGAEMRFYQLPAGSYPHDVAPAPDGIVWFSGQQQGLAGRFDPQTGNLEKIPLGRGAVRRETPPSWLSGAP
jgi:streptogramin lyase